MGSVSLEDRAVQRTGSLVPRSLRSSVRLSGVDFVADSFDDSRATRRKMRNSLLSMRISSANHSVVENQRTSAIALESDQNSDVDDDEIAPTEEEKTMTWYSGSILLCKSMLGGGMSITRQSFTDTNCQTPLIITHSST
jgi:hypothetical protein